MLPCRRVLQADTTLKLMLQTVSGLLQHTGCKISRELGQQLCCFLFLCRLTSRPHYPTS